MAQNDSQPRSVLKGEPSDTTARDADVFDIAPKVHTEKAGSKVRVLVIDDDHNVADTLAMVLKFGGYDSDVAYSGEAGLELKLFGQKLNGGFFVFLKPLPRTQDGF